MKIIISSLFPPKRGEKWLQLAATDEKVKFGFSKILKDLRGVNGFA